MNILKYLSPLTVFLIPAIASAATVTSKAAEFLAFIDNVVVPVIFGIAFVVFIWGVFQYFIAGGSDEKRKEGRQFILYAIIGFVVMVSVWGIVRIVTTSLGFSGETKPLLPCFNGNNCNKSPATQPSLPGSEG